MMAMLFACRVVEERTKFDQVPRLLKQQVAEAAGGRHHHQGLRHAGAGARRVRRNCGVKGKEKKHVYQL